MTLLIIDDDPILRGLLFAHAELADCGAAPIEILEAGSAAEALGKIWAANAILCDGLEGEWVKVWAAARKRGARFVLLSGDDRQVTQARLIGVRAFSKPGGTGDAIAAAVASSDSRFPIADSQVGNPAIQEADIANARGWEEDEEEGARVRKPRVA